MKVPYATHGLAPEQGAALESDGIAALPGAIPTADARSLADALWDRLKQRHGVDRTRRETWTIERPSGLGPLGPGFRRIVSPTVRAAVDDLLGAGCWPEPKHRGIALVSFPTAGQWEVPHLHWHLDVPGAAQDPPLARLFAILEPLRPGGGGTVYVAGSHRLVRRLAESEGHTLHSAEVRRMLRQRHPWFAELCAADSGPDRVRKFMHEGAVIDGVPVRVGEMTGDPGDVLLMHPFTLHALAPNVRDGPRLVVTQWINGSG